MKGSLGRSWYSSVKWNLNPLGYLHLSENIPGWIVGEIIQNFPRKMTWDSRWNMIPHHLEYSLQAHGGPKFSWVCGWETTILLGVKLPPPPIYNSFFSGPFRDWSMVWSQFGSSQVGPAWTVLGASFSERMAGMYDRIINPNDPSFCFKPPQNKRLTVGF